MEAQPGHVVEDGIRGEKQRADVNCGSRDPQLVGTAGSCSACAAVGSRGAQRALRLAPWPPGVQLAVRMGVHTGAAEERDGNFYGVSVNRAARVMGVAPGGVVLAFAAVAELVRDGCGHDIEMLDVGEHRLRGLPGAERVCQFRPARNRMNTREFGIGPGM